jgi:predicted DNA repair protein MutK
MWIFLQKKCKKTFGKKFWEILVLSLPFIIKLLSIIWTWAMLVVAWGLFRHNINFAHHFYEKFHFIPSIIFDTLLGFVIWYVMVILFLVYEKIKNWH